MANSVDGNNFNWTAWLQESAPGWTSKDTALFFSHMVKSLNDTIEQLKAKSHEASEELKKAATGDS